MPFSINIGNFKVNSINNNANINLGPTVQDSNTANSKVIGCTINLGDHCIINTKQVTKSVVSDMNKAD
ncbi:hypothetical protein QE429_001270 [Bacillus sp. SORGH_AS 510]|uniref:spore germination protein n=1 Tax=Bacillus sp. SORGH_AS_0510 TaxID=3041771 RepID=UPI0027853C46|nr:hypothetical protein [Bacillus sp. SORGH_AS_0510]